MPLIRDLIAHRLAGAVQEAQRLAVLPAGGPPAIVVERPQNPEHGDFASNLPLRLARSVRMSPLEIAEKLAPLVPEDEAIERVWAAPPGFLNFALKQEWLQRQVTAINAAGQRYGDTDGGAGQRVQVEFVSVNPTGPIHVGHARGGVLGSALANVLAAAGYDVVREYYFNDAGTQMEAFYASLFVRYAQALGREDIQLPPNGYRGQYLVEMGAQMARELGERYLEMPCEEAVAEIGSIGLDRMMDASRRDMERAQMRFDVWFRERDLYAQGQYGTAMQLLRDNGYVVEREGATWFASASLGDDKDNVLVRSTGHPTYFATDVAYHYNKLVERSFDRVIDVWGADHQGHVQRMKAVVAALGIDPSRLTIIITQLVTLKRAGETVRASKRTGEIVTLEELLDEVGPDACRFFFLARSAESQMEFDLELAKKQSADNPVYYVQYAHARIASILRLAQERGIDWDDGDVSLLAHDAELGLVRKMAMLPEVVDAIARTLEPHHLPHYAMELATAFHWFYDHCRVVSSDPADQALTRARLKLCLASKTVLGRALSLMGMTAPEAM